MKSQLVYNTNIVVDVTNKEFAVTTWSEQFQTQEKQRKKNQELNSMF
jgi:hypothetical protein